MARTAQQLVEREVLVCTSRLVSMLAGGCAAITADNRDLVDLCEQAIELASPVDDWEEAAREAGFEIRHDMHGYYWCRAEEAAFEDDGNPSVGFDGRDHFATIEDAARNVCEEFDIEPYQREVFEHWAVTQWFGEILAARGEKVDFDFAGMIIWARTTTGQAISIDYVVEKIAEDLANA